MQRDELKNLSKEQLENLVCKWVTRHHELESEMFNSNRELKKHIDKQREKINSLQMELEEEKGKTITITENGITMHYDKWGIVNENKSLREENNSLKRHIKDLEDACDGRCFAETASENEIDKDALIAKLQDQHQQDCIRINDLTTTVHVMAGLCSALRKNAGMD